MALYEHVYLARQDISPQQVETLTGQFKTIITSLGGTVGKVEYWGPQSRKKVKFNFDTTRTRAADEDVEWQVTHNRPASTMHQAAMTMACGGGKEQMEDAMQ